MVAAGASKSMRSPKLLIILSPLVKCVVAITKSRSAGNKRGRRRMHRKRMGGGYVSG